ncbi:hypothetical protein [Paraburkholderia sp. RL17-347-BIC-D]|uniref:hypothetical protein n=1 Tax=Paraburkholderia sp. RL17-347-BIC-D TaxID=3031632 RepID=UPI0038B8D41D
MQNGIHRSPVLLASALTRLCAQSGNIATAPEIARFALGLKPALRFMVGVDSVESFSEAVEAAGAFSSTRMLETSSRGGSWSDISGATASTLRADIAAIYIAHDANLAAELALADVTDASVAGEVFGYPNCCVAAVAELQSAGARWPEALVRRSGSPEQWDAAANRAVADWGAISPVGELFPCGLGCKHAVRIGREGVAALSELGLSRLADAIRHQAARPWQITADGRAVPSVGEQGFALPWK